ncbi:MAG: BioY family transporter [Candidatus Pelagibacter sp.]|jgi:biotin transport system substrate-specific component|nr:BioY family transporter [Candidatus Pelagibacter sp.]|tara:strand:- start:7 stop:552 length:546 start_codon:yes stop_codon:yes gene_type:complete
MELIKNLKEVSLVKNLFLAILGTILLAISAKIKIPFWPVPMTMQTFVVLLLGILYGWKLGLFTVSLYLFEGAMGLPVFAGTPEKGIGLVYFTGPTMGYLIGFIFAVFFTGFFKFNDNIIENFLKLLFSVSFIYFFGLIWLGYLIGWDKPIFDLGAKPFLLAELFKVLILAILTPRIFKIKN